MTAMGIAKIRDFKDSIFFRATCSCMTPSHDQTLIVELDDLGMITTTIYSEITHCNWATERENFFPRTWSRLKAALCILFVGRIQYENDFIFESAEASRDYANAILKATDELERRQKEHQAECSAKRTTEIDILSIVCPRAGDNQC